MTALLDALLPARRAEKAVVGPGFISSSTYQPLWTADTITSHRDPRRVIREAQTTYYANPWIRACENLIGQRFSTVSWHLEDGEDNEIDDQSSPQLRAIWELIERPYRPQKGDPITPTPRTRAQLWKVTSRHLGLCNVAAWFLNEIDATAGVPTEILYLNPARLTPGLNESKQLTHWLLDANEQGENGTRLEIPEVLLFVLEPPETGFFGTGLVESAAQTAELARLTERFAMQILQTGGRQGGVISPHDGQLNDNEYEQLQRDVRVMNEGPDAAKRWLVLRGPIEYTRTTSTPTELNLLELAQVAKDDILAMWGVPATQLGVAAAAGLNSGATKDADFEVLWQNAVGPRLRAFRETLQFEFLDRYKALGQTVEMEIEEPTFDDKFPLFELAGQAANQPLRNSERRALLGLEPFGEPSIDNAVWMPTNVIAMGQAPDEDGNPVPMAPVLEEIRHQQALAEARPTVPVNLASQPFPALTGKAKVLPPISPEERDRLATDLRADVVALLEQMRSDVAQRAEERYGHLVAKPSDVTAIFDASRWERALDVAMAPHVASIAAVADKRVAVVLPGKASLQDTIGRLLKKVGVRVRDITATTRQEVQRLVREGIANGLSAAQLAQTLRDATTFDELRAETIARTETGTLLNLAAADSYRSLGVEKVLIYDGEGDDVCAAADGQEWTVDEFESDPLGHPNCVRDAAPIVGGA